MIFIKYERGNFMLYRQVKKATGEKDALLEEIAKRMGLIQNESVVLP